MCYCGSVFALHVKNYHDTRKSTNNKLRHDRFVQSNNQMSSLKNFSTPKNYHIDPVAKVNVYLSIGLWILNSNEIFFRY